MKLFLCGGGSGNTIRPALEIFGKAIDNNKPLLYVPLAMKKEKYPSCFEWIKKEMSVINVNDIEMVQTGEDIAKKKLSDYCAIFIGGGNTYKLLKELKDSNSFQKIAEFINNDGIIFGGSAGAIIFGKDINSCKTQDPNEVDLKDTKGFNVLYDMSLLCHLNRNDGIKFDRNKNSKYLFEFSKICKTIYLPDDDVIYVNGQDVRIIGNSKYNVYDQGNVSIGTPDKILDYLNNFDKK